MHLISGSFDHLIGDHQKILSLVFTVIRNITFIDRPGYTVLHFDRFLGYFIIFCCLHTDVPVNFSILRIIVHLCQHMTQFFWSFHCFSPYVVLFLFLQRMFPDAHCMHYKTFSRGGTGRQCHNMIVFRHVHSCIIIGLLFHLINKFLKSIIRRKANRVNFVGFRHIIVGKNLITVRTL